MLLFCKMLEELWMHEHSRWQFLYFGNMPIHSIQFFLQQVQLPCSYPSLSFQAHLSKIQLQTQFYDPIQYNKYNLNTHKIGWSLQQFCSCSFERIQKEKYLIEHQQRYKISLWLTLQIIRKHIIIQKPFDLQFNFTTNQKLMAYQPAYKNSALLLKICIVIIIAFSIALFYHSSSFVRQLNLNANKIQLQQHQHHTSIRLLSNISLYSARETPNRKMNIKIYNQDNLGGVFPFRDKFTTILDIPQIHYVKNKTLKELGFLDKIQLGSAFDYLNLTTKLDFNKLSEQFYNLIPYEQITIPHDQTLEKQLPKIELKHFKNDSTDDDKFQQVIGFHPRNKNFQFQLARKMFFHANQIRNIEAEYQYYDKRYNIGKYKQQVPICIFSPGGKLVPKNNYKQYFESLQVQNYSNFHIVYVYDNAPQEQIQVIVDYLQKNKFKFNNRIKIIHTFTRLDVLGNMYFFINRYCDTNDVVISVDADDALFGRQPLKVLNAVYQDPKIWAANSLFIFYDKQWEAFYKGNQSGNMTERSYDYRTSFKWQTSHIRTFRKKLFEKIPFYMYIEYHINLNTHEAYPTFFSYAPDAFQMFNVIELAGDDHYLHIDDFLYYYTGVGSSDPKNCYVGHAPYDAHKSRLKTPFHSLQSLDQPAKQKELYQPPQYAIKIMKNAYQTYLQCGEHWNNQPHQLLIILVICLGSTYLLISLIKLIKIHKYEYIQMYEDCINPGYVQENL